MDFSPESLTMKTVAIIPARMAATRFPNKPLAKISGIPMIGHILKRVQLSKMFDQVYVATPDHEIFSYVESIGGQAVMTAHEHERCTDRTAEALFKIEEINQTKFDIVAMIQGDEPLVVPEVFKQALDALGSNSDLPLVNIIGEIHNDEEFESPNTVKVVMDDTQHALYFSREPIPSRKKFLGSFKKFKQTGMIFFRRHFLIEFNQMTPTLLEKIESVDMMRVLEHGKKIKLVLTANQCLGVDVPSDVQKVEKYMTEDLFYQNYKKDFHI